MVGTPPPFLSTANVNKHTAIKENERAKRAAAEATKRKGKRESALARAVAVEQEAANAA